MEVLKAQRKIIFFEKSEKGWHIAVFFAQLKINTDNKKYVYFSRERDEVQIAYL